MADKPIDLFMGVLVKRSEMMMDKEKMEEMHEEKMDSEKEEKKKNKSSK